MTHPKTRRAFHLTLLPAVLLLAACACHPHHPATETNLGQLKTHLRQYQSSGTYESEIRLAEQPAVDWLRLRAPQVQKPALVLDIDETSLSNWSQLVANDFGYIPKAPCDALPKGPCGMEDWQRLATAPAIAPTHDLFVLARQLGVSVFFVTGRPEHLREVTASNLHNAGYDGYVELRLRPEGQSGPVAPYKSGERAAIEAEGYTIIANIGDQWSDLDGGHAEKAFKLPNPFYFLP